MWDVPGKSVDPRQFMPMCSVKVLYEFDGPKTFTFRDHDGELYLAHWCDEGDGLTRHIVVAFSGRLTALLEQGALSLRDALEQPRAWVIDEDEQGVVRSAWRVDVAELPQQVLPTPGTLLKPALEATGASAMTSKSA